MAGHSAGALDRASTARPEQTGGPEAYAFAARDAVELHLHAVPEFDEAAVGSVMYLRVDDADALWQEWQGSNGRLVPPENTPYGLREGAHVDPDGNLIRFGSPLTVTAP